MHNEIGGADHSEWKMKWKDEVKHFKVTKVHSKNHSSTDDGNKSRSSSVKWIFIVNLIHKRCIVYNECDRDMGIVTVSVFHSLLWCNLWIKNTSKTLNHWKSTNSNLQRFLAAVAYVR